MGSYVRREKFKAQLLAMELGNLVAGALGDKKAGKAAGPRPGPERLISDMGITIR